MQPSLAAILSFVSLGMSAPTADAVGVDLADRLDAAMRRANDDPAAGADELSRLLDQMQRTLARTPDRPEAQRLRADAQLALARARLASGDTAGGSAAMDEAIRTHRETLQVDHFGPTLEALHAERERALAKLGMGSIEVQCRVPCRVLVNERSTDASLEGLYAGRYRVHIESSAPGDAATPTPLDLEIDVSGPTALTWPAPGPVAAPADSATDAGPRERARMLPRWAEVVAMAVGAAAIGAGASLLAIDGRCPRGANPEDPNACPQVYVTQTPGIAALAAGGAVLVVGGVLLSVDEVRVRRGRAQSLSLALGFRF